MYSGLSTPDTAYQQGEFEANVRHITCQDFGVSYASFVILSSALVTAEGGATKS